MAAEARQSKVLRIAIIQDKSVKQERLIKAGEPVTIGSDPNKNTFVIPANPVTGDSFLLFDSTGGGYTLRFNPSFGGKSKVALDGKPTYLQDMQGDERIITTNGTSTLALSSQTRGRLEFGSVKVLFQFVPPPPVKAVKAIQAMDFRPKLLEDDDPVFLGFLALWSALAVVLAIWVTNSELPVYEMDDLPDRFANIRIAPKPKPEPEPEIIDETKEEPVADDAPEVEVAAKPAPAERPAPGPVSTEQAQAIDNAKDDLLKNSKLLIGLIGTTGDTSGDTVAQVFGDGSGVGDLDSALRNKTGGVATDAGDPGIRDGGGGGTGELASIGSLGAGGAGGTADIGKGPAVKVIPSVAVGSGSVDSAEAGDSGKVKNTVRKYSGQMKYCYETRLKANPSLEGRVELGWYVSGGKVTGAPYVVSNGTGDAALGTCMVNKLKRWRFPADVEGDIQWPWRFSAKK